MSGYTVALFIHMLGVTVLFVGIAFQQRAGARLRKAGTLEEVRLWIWFLRPTGGMLPAALIVLLFSGLYMTAQDFTIRTPWIATALVTVIGMALVGVTLLRSGLEGIGRRSASGDGPVPPEVAGRLRAPGTWVALSAINGAAVGVLWLMTNKPGWAASIGVVAGASALGAGIGAAVSRSAGRRG